MRFKARSANHVATTSQFDRLQQLLLPVLAEAAIGNFKANLTAEKDQSREFNELVMGVQALLEVIEQQQAEISELTAQMHQVQNQTTEILARVLDRSLPDGQKML